MVFHGKFKTAGGFFQSLHNFSRQRWPPLFSLINSFMINNHKVFYQWLKVCYFRKSWFYSNYSQSSTKINFIQRSGVKCLTAQVLLELNSLFDLFSSSTIRKLSKQVNQLGNQLSFITILKQRRSIWWLFPVVTKQMTRLFVRLLQRSFALLMQKLEFHKIFFNTVKRLIEIICQFSKTTSTS